MKVVGTVAKVKRIRDDLYVIFFSSGLSVLRVLSSEPLSEKESYVLELTPYIRNTDRFGEEISFRMEFVYDEVPCES